MRKSVAAMTVLATMFLPMLSAIADDSGKEKVIKLPQEVREYYQANNFIILFSSVDERAYANNIILVRRLCEGNMVLKEADEMKLFLPMAPHGYIIIPKEADSYCKSVLSKQGKRFERIAEQMAILNKRVIKIGIRGVEDIGPYSNSAYDRFFQIQGIRCRKDEMAVEISAQSLDPQAQFRLVSHYKDDASIEENLRGVEKSLEKSDARMMTEIHRWTLVDEKWMKHEADLLLLESGSSGTSFTNCN